VCSAIYSAECLVTGTRHESRIAVEVKQLVGRPVLSRPAQRQYHCDPQLR